MSCPTGEMVRPLDMSQMAFIQEQVTVQVYIVYSIITCYYSGQAEWNVATGRISLPITQ